MCCKIDLRDLALYPKAFNVLKVRGSPCDLSVTGFFFGCRERREFTVKMLSPFSGLHDGPWLFIVIEGNKK